MSQIPERVFEVDFKRLVLLKLVGRLRAVKQIAWLQCLTIPVMIVYDQFKGNRTRNLYSLAHNGQVCYLRKVLNDAFDHQLRRIKISDGNKFTRTYIYTNGEQQPKYLGRIYLRQRDDFADTGVDFRVVVPIGFDIDQVIHQMNALIKFYKLAGRRYKIEYDE